MTVPMHAETIKVWAAIAAAGQAGVRRLALIEQLGLQPPHDAFNKRLSNLVQQDYISRGSAGEGGFLYKATGKVPPGAASAAAVADGEDLDTDHLFKRREPVKGVPPGVPNSVFALGDSASTGVRSAVGTEFAATTLDGVDIDHVHQVIAEAAGLPHAQGVVSNVAKTGEPHFELHSNGTLVIWTTARSWTTLKPDVTRAFFAWLDQLGGLHLQRLLPKQGGRA